MLLAVFLAFALVNAKYMAGWGEHFLHLQPNGQVFGLGKNVVGQLGLGLTSPAVYFPLPMLNVDNATFVAAGTIHSCIVEKTGQAKCVGKDVYGQLGDSLTKDRSSLGPVTGLPYGVAKLSCGPGSSCALLTNGVLRCWGYNSGNLGDGTITNRLVPTPMVGFERSGAMDVSMGSSHTCILTTSGQAQCTGYNLYGQLGEGSVKNYVTLTPVAGPAKDVAFTLLATGTLHSCAANSQVMYCWGAGMYGQLGVGSQANAPTPVKLATITPSITGLWASNFATFLVLADGTVRGFGDNLNGVLGNGNKVFQTRPVAFVLPAEASKIVEVRGGSPTTCVLDDTGAVYCVGSNGSGQMGVGAAIKTSLTALRLQMKASGPTVKPSAKVTTAPSKKPTKAPTSKPTQGATKAPTAKPTKGATTAPSKKPTKAPTAKPTQGATKAPTAKPTKGATTAPSKKPTKAPTAKPTKKPTNSPTKKPTKAPTAKPTKKPTKAPTAKPIAS
ncbi:hypothetical protein BASA81_006893 [Batrachochytrium salamandrivorans]|nr:hypothetical protein BASA81_006893 [Batrachochytrium salamandrivorans]